MTLRILPVLLLLAGATAALGASCHRDPPVPVAASSDSALCQHLAALGCRTGLDSSCPVALARMRLLGPVPDACLMAATTPAGIHSCGLECEP